MPKRPSAPQIDWNDPRPLPLWPDAGQLLGLGRSRTYESAKTGEIVTIRFGQLLKVPRPWLKRKLDGEVA